MEAQQQRIAVLDTQREAAVAAVEQARAARDLAQIDLDNTIVHAPVSGVVGNRQVRIGRLVAPGVPLLDLVPVDDLFVVANFKENSDRGHLRPGQRVRITIDGYPEEALEGAVDSFAPGSGSAFSLLPADNATGNFVRVVQRIPVKIRFLGNPLPGRLVPGLSARVEVEWPGDAAVAKTASRIRLPGAGSSRKPVPEAMRKAMIAEALVEAAARYGRVAAGRRVRAHRMAGRRRLPCARRRRSRGRPWTAAARCRPAGRPTDASSAGPAPGNPRTQRRLGARRDSRGS